MTRIRRNPDGTRDLLSWSYSAGGQEAANEALRATLAELEASNRQARAEWERLSPEERERRTAEFHRQEADIPLFLRKKENQ